MMPYVVPAEKPLSPLTTVNELCKACPWRCSREYRLVAKELLSHEALLRHVHRAYSMALGWGDYGLLAEFFLRMAEKAVEPGENVLGLAYCTYVHSFERCRLVDREIKWKIAYALLGGLKDMHQRLQGGVVGGARARRAKKTIQA